MNRHLLIAILLCGVAAPPSVAQVPAPGVRFRVQLIAADTAAAAKADPRVLNAEKSSMVMVQCVRPDPGPRLARGDAAPAASAFRMTNAKATLGSSLRMFVMFKDGAEILMVLPERSDSGAPRPGGGG